MKTNSTGSYKTAFIIARVLSAIFVGFTLFLLIGSLIEGTQKTNPQPTSIYTIKQLVLFGFGLLGLILAWKWKITGGVISLVAFIALFIVNMNALVWIMVVFPANALLFILIGIGSKGDDIYKQ